jgi:hypothetical protein
MAVTGYVLASSGFTPATLSEHILPTRRSVNFHWHDPELGQKFICFSQISY